MKTKTGAWAYAAALLFTLGAGAAQAANETNADVTVRSVTVYYHTDSLATEEGRAALRERLETAAGSVCGRRNVRDRELWHRWKECYDAALADAINRVGSERVARAE